MDYEIFCLDGKMWNKIRYKHLRTKYFIRVSVFHSEAVSFTEGEFHWKKHFFRSAFFLVRMTGLDSRHATWLGHSRLWSSTGASFTTAPTSSPDKTRYKTKRTTNFSARSSFLGADDGTWTHMNVHSLVPETSASANSATSAYLVVCAVFTASAWLLRCPKFVAHYSLRQTLTAAPFRFPFTVRRTRSSSKLPIPPHPHIWLFMLLNNLVILS